MKSVWKFGALTTGVLGMLILASCQTTLPPEKSAGQKALDKVAQSKSISGSTTTSEIDLNGQKYRVTEVAKTNSNGNFEAVLVLEKPDGSFELNGFSGPTDVDEVNADQLDTAFVTQLLDENGNVKSTLKLGEVQGDVNAQGIAALYKLLKTAAALLVAKYGTQILTLGCDTLINRLSSTINWRPPWWLKWAACRALKYFIKLLASSKPKTQIASVPANLTAVANLTRNRLSTPRVITYRRALVVG